MNFMRARASRNGVAEGAPGALIIGGAQVSIGLARSLGRRGIPVWVVSNHPLPKFSRYVQRNFVWPGAEHAHAFSALVDIIDNHDLSGWVLLATGDEDMRLIAKNHSALSSRLRVLSPTWDTAKWMLDKRYTYARADVAWNRSSLVLLSAEPG